MYRERHKKSEEEGGGMYTGIIERVRAKMYVKKATVMNFASVANQKYIMAQPVTQQSFRGQSLNII